MTSCSGPIRVSFGLGSSRIEGVGGENLADLGPTFKRGGARWGQVPGFRRPEPPWPIERFEIEHASVPRAWSGLAVLHLSDFHVRRGRRWPGGLRRLLGVIGSVEVDLIALTGDSMDHPGDEESAIGALECVAAAWCSRLGAVGIFGNHDTPRFREMARARVPGVRWIETGVIEVAPGLRVAGVSSPEDAVGLGMTLREGESPVLTLAHDPSSIYALSRLGVEAKEDGIEGVGVGVVLAGHTHGGQVRPWSRWVPHASCDLPRDASTGLIGLGGTVMAVSRGLGEAVVPVRVNCPAHAPLYELRRGGSVGDAVGAGRLPRSIVAW